MFLTYVIPCSIVRPLNNFPCCSYFYASSFYLFLFYRNRCGWIPDGCKLNYVPFLPLFNKYHIFYLANQLEIIKWHNMLWLTHRMLLSFPYSHILPLTLILLGSHIKYTRFLLTTHLIIKQKLYAIFLTFIFISYSLISYGNLNVEKQKQKLRYKHKIQNRKEVFFRLYYI